jgi:lysozyme
MILQEIINKNLVLHLAQFDQALVKDVQSQLNLHGFELIADGLMGPKTKTAIAIFCKSVYLNSETKDSYGKSFAAALLSTTSVKVNSSDRRINQAGLDLIKESEGVVLHEYPDAVGVSTIGYGHTVDVRRGDKISYAEAESYLQNDLHIYETAVSALVKVPLNDNQFAALVSFAFNVGVGALTRSTLLKCLNNGCYQSAADAFGNWVYAGDRSLPGLVARRKAERSLFLA